jgi:hypothetical protein
MILSPEVYNKITAVVFTRQEPTVTTVFWARPSNPEGTGFDFFVFDNGSWQSLSQYDNVIIPEVDPYLSAFINDVGFYTVPTGGIPSTDLSEAVQTALTAAGTAYQKPSTGIPSTDLSSAVQTSLGKADTAIQTETDPTVPSWAKASSKPSYTASEVGALPDDTPLFSGSYNDLSDKPTIPTVPTNVSAFTNDAGYLTSHQDISGKEDKVDIVSASGATLSAEVGKYYTLSSVGTLAITLPTIASGTTTLQTVTFYIEAGSSPAVTFTSAQAVSIIKSDGFAIEANGVYEVSAAWNGKGWIIAQLKLDYVAPVVNVKTKSTGNQNAAITVTKDEIATDILYTDVDNGDDWDNGVVKVQYSPSGYTGWCVFALADVYYNGTLYTSGSLVNNWAYNSSTDFDIYY